MDPLEAATTDDLIAELGRRYEALLVAAVKVTPGDARRETVSIEYRGGLCTARGLALEAADRLAAESACGETSDPGDEP